MYDKIYQGLGQAFKTDFYELTMSAGYFQNNVNALTTFELFIRKLPNNRSYLIFAGLEQVIEYLLNLRFTNKEISFLRKMPVFKYVKPEFFDYLKKFRFRGDLWSVPEGTIIFENEPVLRVTANIIESQIVETFFLSVINFQTLIATKASRVVHSARGKGVADFGTRRAHGPEAGILAARASYIGGCLGTSNVYAGYKFNIPLYGTAAHSYTMAFDSELEAFQKYYATFPETTLLLIDTYDIEEGVKNAIKIGKSLKGVRIDSDNIIKKSRIVRKMLDEAGLQKTKIFATGDLNEYKIDEILKSKAPVDMFGVGTEMVTSRDDPALGGVYKLVEQITDNKVKYRAKFSLEKSTYPGKKQIFRRYAKDGMIKEDLLTLANASRLSDSEPLLKCYIKNGKLIRRLPELAQTRQMTIKNLETLPDKYKNIYKTVPFKVKASPELIQLFKELQRRYFNLKSLRN